MRVGMLLAAAAALVTGAGQASAARYYEIKITSIFAAPVTAFVTNGYVDNLDIFFDSNQQYSALANQSMYAGSGPINIQQNYSGSQALIFGLSTPYGPQFSFVTDLTQASSGSSQSPLTPSNTNFSYTMDGGRYAIVSSRGAIYSVLARTFDTPPAVIGFTDSFSQIYAPEPATWGMMILGIGVVGLAMRRRKSREQAGGHAASPAFHPR